MLTTAGAAQLTVSFVGMVFGLPTQGYLLYYVAPPVYAALAA